MANAVGEGERPAPSRWPGWKTSIFVMVFYAVCLAIGTAPVFLHLSSALPGDRPDALMHLWVMRWYKACLLQGTWPWYCPDLQYPIGAPLGKFSPLHFQSLLYLLLSIAIHNDTLCYNLLWVLGFLLNGLGTFLLIWYVLRNRASACLGGLMAMLCGSMMVHSVGHLELLYVGWFPLFMIAWIRFVDQPGRGRMLTAAALYILVAMAAAYFMIQAIFPAALYLGWRAVQVERAGLPRWIQARIGWIAGFTATALPMLAVLFSGPIWAAQHGFTVNRPESHFTGFVAPLWSYAVPMSAHRLSRLMPYDVYEVAGYGSRVIEAASYLGVVTLVFLGVAGVRRVNLPRASFWWLALGLMMILAVGPWLSIGEYRIAMPAHWLWKNVFFFRWTRNPGRFNLFATIFAVLLASAGLRELLVRIRYRAPRLALCASLAGLILLDLGMTFPATATIPEMPGCYQFVTRAKAHPALLELPLVGSEMPVNLISACGYWQSIHGARTTAGYSGNDNIDFDNCLYHASPFSWRRPGDPRFDQATMSDPQYLQDPDNLSLNLVRGAAFDDYAWLFVHAHQFDYMILHKWDDGELGPNAVAARDRLRCRLSGAEVYEDAEAVVYEPNRMPTPTRPVLLCTDGWRFAHPWQSCPLLLGRPRYAMGQSGRLAIYNPTPDHALTVTLVAIAYRKPRTVRLLAGDRELARWQIETGDWKSLQSPPFRLPAGLQTLTVQTDGASRVQRPHHAVAETDLRPYSLHVTEIRLGLAPCQRGIDRLH